VRAGGHIRKDDLATCEPLQEVPIMFIFQKVRVGPCAGGFSLGIVAYFGAGGGLRLGWPRAALPGHGVCDDRRCVEPAERPINRVYSGAAGDRRGTHVGDARGVQRRRLPWGAARFAIGLQHERETVTRRAVLDVAVDGTFRNVLQRDRPQV
jgi:hypothetical protein